MSDDAGLPVVLVTGANRGIGRAVAVDLATDHRLLIGGRDADEVQQVCAQLSSAQPFVADLADEQATARAAGSVQRVDAVVHSAGMLGSGLAGDLSRTDWRRVLELNVIAVADLTRLLLPQLRERKGTVVLINSGSGLSSTAGGGLYAASKFALRAYADALREEERAHGVRVSSIHPGRVATDMQQELNNFEGRDYDESRYLTPESVAAAVRLAITAPRGATVEMLSVRPGPN
ncbi:SDR family oxidoreductase [Leekyejoonella antrihumi]|uniref:SDR family oxidoreductase n=1 Tax=Leekyejoonella antrihumi TaxID=1660198 RepID=A0A563E5F4_9MICO|nr:SDR family oxidoreductase [Leekyejoonella antrihumi]TWP37421.1 SDR family oxidoreductase [Leekyejoonella antrihumi]